MRTLAFLCCLFVASPCAGRQRGEDKLSRVNVFLITIDTLRADHIHCYGYEEIRTPALDALAKQGIRFTQAFTPSPITNSSHASILTGLLPSSHGVGDFGVPLTPTHVTLAELLAKEGYHTAAFIGAVILDSKRLAPGFDRGFDFYDNFPAQMTARSGRERLERRGMQVEQHAEAWLNAHSAGSHFVWVHLYDPHDPYEPPPPYSNIYKDRLYDGEIAYADSALQHFTDYLKKQGWYNEGLIVIVGDHGEGLGEHHEDTHGIFLYDSTMHVPLLVKLPGNREPGKVVDEQVRTTDIMPTILELVGLAAPEKLDGASLRPLFVGAEERTRAVYGQTDYPLHFGWAPLRSVRKEGFKFIEAPNPELYDLRSDAGELVNKYEPWNSEVQKLRRMLNTASSARESVSAAAVPATTIGELRALGYLGPDDARGSIDVPQPSLLPDPKDKIEEQNLLHAAIMAAENEEPTVARNLLEKVLQSDDKSEIALRELGQLEAKSGNRDEAAEHLRRAHNLRPNDAALGLDYARAQESRGDLEGARDTLQATLKLNPDQVPCRILLGQLLFRLGQTEKALGELEDAALLQPENVEIKTSLSRVLLGQKKFADAVDILEPLANSSSDDAVVLAYLAQAYRGLGRLKDAEHIENRLKVVRRRKTID